MAGTRMAAVLAALPPDSRHRANWLSCSGPHAGAAFGAFATHRDLGMPDDAFVTEACLCLDVDPGWALPLRGHPCPRGCGHTLPSGLILSHALSCGTLVDFTLRAKIIERALAAELRAGLSRLGAHVTTGSAVEYVRYGLVPHQPLPNSDGHRDISQDKSDIVITEPGRRPIIIDHTVCLPSISQCLDAAHEPGGDGRGR
ncbi:hypothetical protein DFJ74DRAFT_676931 [Hyaloraphidium curvatum]|nr:hypothetical protein DFJ74DRAFT_676931 [Hyaloraphidium curvatum]